MIAMPLGQPARRRRRALVTVSGVMSLALATLAVTAPASLAAPARTARAAASSHVTISCGNRASRGGHSVPDVYNPEQAFGHYVGHDEPGASGITRTCPARATTQGGC